jgi:hypothetical protein
MQQFPFDKSVGLTLLLCLVRCLYLSYKASIVPKPNMIGIDLIFYYYFFSFLQDQDNSCTICTCRDA